MLPLSMKEFAPLTLAHRGSALPWLIKPSSTHAEFGAYSPGRALLCPTRLSATNSAPRLSRATTSRRAPNLSSEEAHLVNSILNQPYRHRVSTDRLNHEDSRLAASREGEPGPTPTAKTLQHSYPKNRFSEGEGAVVFGRCLSS